MGALNRGVTIQFQKIRTNDDTITSFTQRSKHISVSPRRFPLKKKHQQKRNMREWKTSNCKLRDRYDKETIGEKEI